jgi:single-strand DNA-binding protein
MNTIHITGNLGKDPQEFKTKLDKIIVSFSLADNYFSKEEKKVTWHRVITFDKKAESCMKYLKKGDSVYVVGRLQNREYDDKDGNKKQITEVIASSVQFQNRASQTSEVKKTEQKEDAPNFDEYQDDLPFIVTVFLAVGLLIQFII